VEDAAKANLTVLGSRIMKTRRGFIQGYNAQAVVSRDQIWLALPGLVAARTRSA
jgi:hypothetical protein